jgi:hypothetical protein
MLIRPPVVREMRHDLWVKMTAKPGPVSAAVDSPERGDSTTAEARLASLKALGELRDAGILTEEEFSREKARLLA